MTGVIRTNLKQTAESIVLGSSRPVVSAAVMPQSLPVAPVSKSMGMAAIAIGAVAPDLAAIRVNADEVESKRLAEARQQARAEGFKHGEEDGRARAAADWQEKLKHLADIVEILQAEREHVLATLEDDVVALAFEAIVRILGELPVTRLIIEQSVRDLCSSGDYRDPITVRVSSEDYELLVGEPAIVELEDRRSAIKLVEDSRLKLGGCIVETSRGALDARIETQLERLRSALLEARTNKTNKA